MPPPTSFRPSLYSKYTFHISICLLATYPLHLPSQGQLQDAFNNNDPYTTRYASGGIDHWPRSRRAANAAWGTRKVDHEGETERYVLRHYAFEEMLLKACVGYQAVPDDASVAETTETDVEARKVANRVCPPSNQTSHTDANHSFQRRESSRLQDSSHYSSFS